VGMRVTAIVQAQGVAVKTSSTFSRPASARREAGIDK